MRTHVVDVMAPLVATAVFWTMFGACVDGRPPVASPPRLIASWNSLACGDPHHVVVELEDEAGARQARAAPCERGSVTLDAPHGGRYRWWISALHVPARSNVGRPGAIAIAVAIDRPIVRWSIMTPP